MAEHYRMVSKRAQDSIRAQGRNIRRQGYMIRMPVFMTALVLIAAGFLIQIARSWPGGIPALGVTASG
jgi:hypothetical protein